MSGKGAIITIMLIIVSAFCLFAGDVNSANYGMLAAILIAIIDKE